MTRPGQTDQTQKIRMTTGFYARALTGAFNVPEASPEDRLVVELRQILSAAAHSGIVDLVPDDKPSFYDRLRYHAHDLYEALDLLSTHADQTEHTHILKEVETENAEQARECAKTLLTILKQYKGD